MKDADCHKHEFNLAYKKRYSERIKTNCFLYRLQMPLCGVYVYSLVNKIDLSLPSRVAVLISTALCQEPSASFPLKNT